MRIIKKSFISLSFFILLFLLFIFTAYQYFQIQKIKDSLNELSKSTSQYSTLKVQDVVDYLYERESIRTFKIGNEYSSELVFTLGGEFNKFSNSELIDIQDNFFKNVYIPRKSVMMDYTQNTSESDIDSMHLKLLEEQTNQVPLMCADTDLYLDYGYEFDIKYMLIETEEDFNSSILCVTDKDSDLRLNYIALGSKGDSLQIMYRWENENEKSSYNVRRVATHDLVPIMLTNDNTFYFGERTGGGGWAASSLFSLDLETNSLTEHFYCIGGIEGNPDGTYGENCVFWEKSLILGYYEMRQIFYNSIENME